METPFHISKGGLAMFRFLIAILRAMRLRNAERRQLSTDREWGLLKEGPNGEELWVESHTGQSVMMPSLDSILNRR
jgi:hypothetical protein